jgi:hypothetical protein
MPPRSFLLRALWLPVLVGAACGGGGGAARDAAGEGAAPDRAGDVTGASDATDRADAADAADAVADGPDAGGGADGADDAAADGIAPASCPSSGRILCESFETTPAGNPPTDSPWLPVPSSCHPFPGPGSILAVQEEKVRSGSEALEANTLTNQCVLSADLGVLSDFWVRVWLRLDSGAAAPADEVTFFGVGSDPVTDDPRVAVGLRGTQGTSPCAQAGLEVNLSGGSGTGCSGRALETDRWYCLELHVTQGSGPTSAALYVDGQPQSFTVHPGGATGTVVAGSFTPPVRYLSLAVRQYMASYLAPAYYDDVAVATQRTGCE